MGVPTLKKSSNSPARIAALTKVLNFSLKAGGSGEECKVGDAWAAYSKLVPKGTLRLFVNSFYDLCAMIHKVLVLSNKEVLVNCWSRSVVLNKELECPYIRYLPLEYNSRLFSNYIVCCEVNGIYAWRKKSDESLAPPDMDRILIFVRLSTLCFIKRDESIKWVCDRVEKYVSTLIDNSKSSLWSVISKKKFVCFYYVEGDDYMPPMQGNVRTFASLKRGLPKPSVNGQQSIAIPKAK
jgi:hypothetical protein